MKRTKTRAMQNNTMKIAVLISGRGSNLYHLILKARHYQICLVIANQAATGLYYAQQADIPTSIITRDNYDSNMAHEQALALQIQDSGAEWICLAGYMSILSAAFINRFSERILNIHPSLLPAYKGLETHKRILADSVHIYHGASVHLVSEIVDAGPVIARSVCAIDPHDTEASLAARVLKREHTLFPMVINAIGNGDVTIQNGQPVWAHRIYVSPDYISAPIEFPPFISKY